MMRNLNKEVLDIPEALSIHVNQIVYDKVHRGERIYTFSLGEAFFNIPSFHITDKEFNDGYHYSSSMGQLELRKKISELYLNYYNVRACPENEILISAGSKIIIYMVLKMLLNFGDEVLVHEPAWLSYREQISLVNGVYKPIPYYEKIQDWEKYITKKTKLIIINNPNNPSGQIYSKEELEHILFLASKYKFYVLSDEAYSDFVGYSDSFISFASIDQNKEYSIIVNSLSKNMGMSGWRVGYAISSCDVIKFLLKLNQHLITCAPTLLQNYMAKHFYEILNVTLPQAKELAIKRKKVQQILNELDIGYLNGDGTFYFMLNVASYQGSTEDLVYTLINQYNIATVPGAAYGDSTKDFIRFGIGVEDLQSIRKCLLVIKSLITK